jgi:hypothetical protein
VAFDTFDADGSGYLDIEEFETMTAMLNDPEPRFPGNFADALEGFDKYVHTAAAWGVCACVA